MPGAANKTTGIISAQDIAQDVSHVGQISLSVPSEKAATKLAIPDVIPDWITANTKWA